MHLYVPLWAWPVLATIAIWVTAIRWPLSPATGGAYNFAPAIDALVHFVVAVIATLFVWLVYLAVRVWITG